MVAHFIVPQEIARQAGMPCPRTARLCRNCSNQLHNWYTQKVFGMAYDPGGKRFIPRSPVELAREYEAAFKAFVTYKKRLHLTA